MQTTIGIKQVSPSKIDDRNVSLKDTDQYTLGKECQWL